METRLITKNNRIELFIAANFVIIRDEFENFFRFRKGSFLNALFGSEFFPRCFRRYLKFKFRTRIAEVGF